MKESSLPKISKTALSDLYLLKRRSVFQISKVFACSENKINYWLSKYKIKKRTISEAMYDLKNPLGDPFLMRQPRTLREGVLFGLGLGLYWGEGSKRGNGGVRLTNSDPKLIRKFVDFLETFCGINKNRLRFSIQIFGDISLREAFAYWKHELGVKSAQFYKTTVSPIRGKGTYKHKSKHGVVIVYFNNIKLKRNIIGLIEKIR